MTNNIEPVEIEKVEIENTDEVVLVEPKKVKSPKNPVIQNDIMRYKKNKIGANLALLGLALGCLYFLVLYAQVKNDNFYYKWPIAIDVIYNLFFLLFVFLFSEQVKNYNRKMFPFQLVLGGMQIVRIFWLPLAGITETAYCHIVGVEFTGAAITAGTFTVMTVCLAASGACIIASAIVGFIRARSVEAFVKKVEAGEVDLDGALKEEENAGGEVNA